ncbi:DNA gyrase, A subunit [Synechococcus sp. PCC 7502]|uniref:DNA gyrase subunit A n=1 Tax=Synechococcus sp. PCC 7502 TaxID=1173263 RepID=UPI00029FA52B|nr:DNA gyrase subunit A [Synechococcus sp. PCC 7502]AFY72958.1 DNA gyrase, A subunit [Synechococcus sp. PCC 7502]
MTNSTANQSDRIVPTDLRGEMSRSYLEYAMSVIVGRALPDARDGLKPVHRRILYAMHELGLTPERPFRKCARVVGDVIGKYHPHGDSSVYEALVRMAQDFSMRERLVDGHGNFGSVDNDPAAAMRYTECRLTRVAQVGLIQDIDAETVNFGDNYDGSQEEPLVLPARIPQLLLNGSSGIAVGMATNIPSHNLGELVDGLVALIANPDLTDLELMQYVQGPDFPTGALILGREAIRETYTTGRGSVTMRAVADFEVISNPGRQDREAIIITELPYQTNKAALIEKIAELVNEKRLDGISDIRDESDRNGMRLVIELKRDAYPKVVLNNLFKTTPLQSNFGCNMLAIVDGAPQVLTLKSALQVFLDFRSEVITRRTQFQLRKAQERDHLLQGLLTALSHLDAIIALIRGADDTASAKLGLIETYGLSEVQADGILQMQLRRLTALEADKIQKEHEELVVEIADLNNILSDRQRVLAITRTELEAIKAEFATPRRTIILDGEGDINTADLIANRETIVLVTEQGYIKRMPVDTFVAQSRATRGKSSTNMKDDDAIDHFFACRSHDSVLFFSDRGKVYSLKGYEIPESSRTARGGAIVQMLPISSEEKITSVLAISEFTDDEFLVMLTAGGYIKKTKLSAFANIRSNGLIAIFLEDNDQLRWVRRAKVNNTIIIGSKQGMAIRFRTDDQQLRPMGRDTRGVRAMRLSENDEIVGMDILPAGLAEIEDVETTDNLSVSEVEESEITDTPEELTEELCDDKSMAPWVLVVTQGGYGKKVPVGQFRIQKRFGKGIRATKFKSGQDQLAALKLVDADEELMIVTSRGIVMRQATNAIACQSRTARGVRLQRLDADDAIADVTLVPAAIEENTIVPELSSVPSGETAVTVVTEQTVEE